MRALLRHLHRRGPHEVLREHACGRGGAVRDQEAEVERTRAFLDARGDGAGAKTLRRCDVAAFDNLDIHGESPGYGARCGALVFLSGKRAGQALRPAQELSRIARASRDQTVAWLRTAARSRGHTAPIWSASGASEATTPAVRFEPGNACRKFVHFNRGASIQRPPRRRY